MAECNVQENKNTCNCTYPCSKKGICCECLRYHQRRGELPACFFPDTIERTYDRSIEKFIEVYQVKTDEKEDGFFHNDIKAKHLFLR